MTLEEYISSLEIELSTDEEAKVRAAWTPQHVATESNGWAVAGLDCECDVDYRCANHDTKAEREYWSGIFVASLEEPVMELELAYEKNDPKHPAYLDQLESVS